MTYTYWPDGTIKEAFDEAGRMYTRFDESGGVVEERPLTQLELDFIMPELVNQRDLTDKVAAQVPDLLVMIADLQVRLDIPKADLGNTELRRTIRDVRQLARTVTQLVRLVGNVLDSTDSGTP